MAKPPDHDVFLSDYTSDAAQAQQRFQAKLVRSAQGCLEWCGSRNEGGYGRVWTRGDRIVLAHRFAALLAHGCIPAGSLVLHTCDNPPCCDPLHLYFGTNADNNADMSSRGRFSTAALQGAGNPNSRLTDHLVREIRSRVRSGETRAALGRELGVSRQTISDIAAGRMWMHVA